MIRNVALHNMNNMGGSGESQVLYCALQHIVFAAPQYVENAKIIK
jgi:hypothetical protein